MEEDATKKATDSLQLALRLLQQLVNDKVELNIIQAAFGSGWLLACRMMGFDKKEFSELVDGVKVLFQEQLEEGEKNG